MLARWLPLVAVLAAPLAASAAPAIKTSDPAFLGVVMDPGAGFCSIRSTTPGSPAEAAGIAFGDMILAIDGHPLSGPNPCDMLSAQIVSHRAGEDVDLEVRRGAQRMKIRATLATRGDVLFRRFVGERIVHTDLADIDNTKVSYDLADRGRTTIVGWFMLEACTNCARVFDQVNDGIKKRLKESDTVPATLAVSAPGRRSDLSDIRKSFTANVSLAVADNELFDRLALSDRERITFMVIDCRGVVHSIAPIAPDAEDLDAAVDDILAAAEQAEHQRTSRR